MVTITTQSQAEAESVERDLARFGASATATPHGWDVNVLGEGDIAPILTALEQCLGTHAIPAVSVTIAGRSYVLTPQCEGAPRGSSATNGSSSATLSTTT